MYRKRIRESRKLANMRAARECKRANNLSPDYPLILPDLRRKIVIIDYDFGKVVHTIELYRTGRIDQYKAVADGKVWQERIGWSKVLSGIRKSFLRVHSV